MKIEIDLNTAQTFALASAFEIDAADASAKQQLERAIKQQLRAVVRAHIAQEEEEARKQRIAQRTNELNL